MMRYDLGDRDKASCYLMCVMTSHGLPGMEADLPTVMPGCACRLQDERGNFDDIIIDPEGLSDAPAAAGYQQSDSPVALQMIGNHVGDVTMVEREFGVPRPYTVVSITSAYRHLLKRLQERISS